MKFKINEDLTREEIEKIRTYIASEANIPTSGIMVFNNGRFEIHQVGENDAGYILNKLQRNSKIKNLNKNSTSYDFSHYTGFGVPKQKYTVSGYFRLDESLLEFLTPILEENEQYHIRYQKEGDRWSIKVLNDSDDVLKQLYCNNVVERDRELEYLKNDYQTMDCCEYKND